MTDTKTLGDILGIITSIITIVGVPIAIIGYFRNKRKERKQHEYTIYNALDDKYIDFLNLCLQNPELNIYPGNAPDNKEMTDAQKNKRLIIFEILISILERAYLMYKDQDTEIRKSQWAGWKKYATDWMNNPNFRSAWKTLSEQYETNFTGYMSGIYAEAPK